MPESTWSSLTLLQYFVLVLVIAYIIYQRLLSPFASVPGPFWAKYSRGWITYHSLKGDLHRTYIALHRKHGKLVRIAPGEVSVADTAAIKTIYGAGSKYRKSDWYSVWQGRRKFDLFPERDEGIHGSQRRLVSKVYSMGSLRDLEPYVDNAIKVFLSKMDQQAHQTIDMGKWVQLFAFDVIGEVTFSKRFGFMDVEEDDGSFGQITMAIRSGAWIGQVPWLYWLHDYLAPIIGNKLAITARHGSLRQFAAREVAARTDRGSDHQDMLGKLIAVHHEKPQEFDYNALVSMATSNIFAGSDTTAISLRAIIYHLLKNPGCKQRLIEEIDDLNAKGELNDPVTLAQADGMPYLQAIMLEALRLHPAVGLTLPRVVPEGGTSIDGQHIPAGSVVGTSPWVIHRDQDVFGSDADQFRPERWLKGGNGDMHRFFFAFGAGARLCIGKNISLMEMSKLVPTLFMHYDIELTQPSKELHESCWWFVVQKGLDVRLRRRLQSKIV